jgi:long-chain acyl-CoA synthetase
MVAQHVTAHGAETILRKKDRGIWKAENWTVLGAHTRAVAMGLRAIDFQPGEVACTLAETRPEWIYADLGILAAGGTSGGLHPAEEPERIGEALSASDCRVLFVENEEQLDKVLAVRERCHALQRIVVFDMKGLRDFVDPMCESFETFVARGSEYDRTHPADWDRGLAAITGEQAAILLIPLGAQGGKGRLLTHSDVLHLVANARSLLGAKRGDERLALLPMCHAMERVFGLYVALQARVVSNYLESTDTELENLQELQPTLLGTDLGLWQRLHARVTAAAAGATRMQGALYRTAIAAARHGGLQAKLARWFVLRAVRRELGLARLRLAYLGGEPLTPELEGWVLALGVTVQPMDSQTTRGATVDARYRALIQEAYGT